MVIIVRMLVSNMLDKEKKKEKEKEKENLLADSW